ncbi:YitT family protein, partial [Bacillus velezensis]
MKYVFYVLGIMILTFGISVTIQSDLGTSPFDALIVGLSVHAGLTVGSWEIIIA